jgi:ribosomal protein S18 acetylase RimI-like enzyme
MEIRPCRGDDWPRLRAIHMAASAVEAPPVGAAARLSLPEPEEGEDLVAGVFVAELDGVIAGFVAVDGDEITWLYVDPARARRGVGRALLRHAVARCGPGARVVVLAGNAPALALYRSEGFEVTGRDPGPPVSLILRLAAG